ncbi:MAG: hypothetical protein AAFN10_14185 [Bacteroidota bacterium]
MQMLSLDQADATYDWLSSIEDEDEIVGIVESFSEAQPVLFTYLMTMGETDFDGDESELMLFLGLIIWQTYLRAGIQLGRIDEQHLEEIKALNVKMIEYLAEEAEEGFEQIARDLMKDSSQPGLLEFLIQIIFEEEADIIKSSNQGIMFIFLKVVIDSIENSLD